MSLLAVYDAAGRGAREKRIRNTKYRTNKAKESKRIRESVN
jgi:hypothetical protein